MTSGNSYAANQGKEGVTLYYQILPLTENEHVAIWRGVATIPDLDRLWSVPMETGACGAAGEEVLVVAQLGRVQKQKTCTGVAIWRF